MPVTVAECEISEAVVIRANQSVRAAAKLMESHNTDLVVVVDKDAIAGVVTATDLVWRVYAVGGTGNDEVRGICDDEVVVASTQDRVSDVVDKVQEAGARRVLVHDDGDLIGTLTREDLFERTGRPVKAVSPHVVGSRFAQRSRETVTVG